MTRPFHADVRGFSLVEVMVATSISTILFLAMATAFVWTMRTTNRCSQYAWAQTEAISSMQQVVSYMRNASAITNIDVAGNWVELVMPPSNTVARFSYVNTSGVAGAGQMLFVADKSRHLGPTNVLARGLTQVTTTPVRNIFVQTGTNSLRLAYRITKPSESGSYPAEIDIGVRLRNN